MRPGRDPAKYSGYQVMRLSTELLPAFAAILGKKITHNKIAVIIDLFGQPTVPSGSDIRFVLKNSDGRTWK